jgi:hypothetical protein
MAAEPIRLPALRGRLAQVQKIVYELRYREGYTYLDRCGRIITLAQRESPEWVLDGQVSPQQAALISLENTSAFKFGPSNLSLSLEKPLGEEPMSAGEVERFFAQADFLTSLVLLELGIGKDALTRIGFRSLYIFPGQDKDELEQWLLDLGCFRFDSRVLEAFGKECESSSASVVVVGEDRWYRLQWSVAERQAQVDLGNAILTVQPRALPKDQRKMLIEREKARSRMRQMADYAVIFDLDSYQEDPQTLDVGHFLTSSWEGGFRRLAGALQAR